MKSAFSLIPLALSATVALAACGQPSRKTETPPSQETAAAANAATAAIPAATAAQSGFDLSAAGQMAPDLALETGPDGKSRTLADIRRANPGQMVLVNLWASWCAPCLRELPTLDSLAAATAGKLVVVPISQDLEGWPKVSQLFTRQAYPNLRTLLDSKMRYGRAIGVHALPVSILYDAEGREVWRYLGDFDWTSAQARARLGV